jgi:hypothetical protein
MAVKNKVTASRQPAAPRPTAVERRAADIAMLSTKQAELKQAAADRRRERELRDAAPAAGLGTPAAPVDAP